METVFKDFGLFFLLAILMACDVDSESSSLQLDDYQVVTGDFVTENGYLSSELSGVLAFEEIFEETSEAREYDLSIKLADGDSIELYSHADCCSESSLAQNGLSLEFTREGLDLVVVIEDDGVEDETTTFTSLLPSSGILSLRIRVSNSGSFPVAQIWSSIPSDSDTSADFISTTEFQKSKGRMWLLRTTSGAGISKATSSVVE